MVPLKKISLVDQLYEQLKAKIINLTYPLGSKLNVSELRSAYQVSSTPIREAMNRLQMEGLVSYESNVGAHVVKLTPQDILEIQDLALALHSTAITLAMKRGDLQKMADEITKYIKGYEAARTIEGRVKNVSDLLRTFYRNCGNKRLDANMKIIQGQQLILRHLFFNHLGLARTKDNPYINIPEAVLGGHTDQIIKILADSYSQATPILLEALELQDQG